MKKLKILIMLLAALVFLQAGGSAQTINCDKIYSIYNQKIYAFDPVMQTYEVLSYTLPEGAVGLAICPNLQDKSGKLTFYTIVNKYIYYYDGSTWVNTGHYSQSVNIAGGGEYLYILFASYDQNNNPFGHIYRYNGSSNPMFLTDLHGFVGPYDLVCDAKGNFYIINVAKNKLVQYDPNGTIVKEYTLSGLSQAGTAGGGFAYRNEVIYAEFTGGTMIGVFENDQISFSYTKVLPRNVDDYASCPLDVFEPEKYVTPADVIFTGDNIPLKIKDRDVVLQSTLNVNRTEFDIEIYDKSVVDGDSVSLNLNGKWILQEYGVVKTKESIHIKLDPRQTNNYLILYALNLGSISPNTAAVDVKIGDKVYKIVLSSDLKKSGALNFVYTPG